jgi:hypothetical protein
MASYFPHKLSLEDVADIRAIPRHKDHVESQHFSSFNALHFKQAVYQYLRLWQQFRVTNDEMKNPLNRRALQQEVEQDLVELLKHCKQRRWLISYFELVGFYLRDCPSRTLALTLAILLFVSKILRDLLYKIGLKTMKKFFGLNKLSFD